MYVLYAFLIINIIIVTHELGHYYEFRKHGISIDTFAIGIPIPKIPSIIIVFTLSDESKFELIISPLLIGGYVAVSGDESEKAQALSYKEYSLILGGGIWMNLIFAFVCLAILSLFIDRFFHFIVFCTLALLLFIFKKFFCRYLIIPFGILTLIIIVFSVFHNPSEAFQGPIGLIKMTKEYSVGLKDYILFLSVCSFSIGLFNMMPIGTLDGGHLVTKLLERRISPMVISRFNSFGSAFMIIFFAVVMSNDLWHLIF